MRGGLAQRRSSRRSCNTLENRRAQAGWLYTREPPAGKPRTVTFIIICGVRGLGPIGGTWRAGRIKELFIRSLLICSKGKGGKVRSKLFDSSSACAVSFEAELLRGMTNGFKGMRPLAMHRCYPTQSRAAIRPCRTSKACRIRLKYCMQ